MGRSSQTGFRRSTQAWTCPGHRRSASCRHLGHSQHEINPDQCCRPAQERVHGAWDVQAEHDNWDRSERERQRTTPRQCGHDAPYLPAYSSNTILLMWSRMPKKATIKKVANNPVTKYWPFPIPALGYREFTEKDREGRRSGNPHAPRRSAEATTGERRINPRTGGDVTRPGDDEDGSRGKEAE